MALNPIDPERVIYCTAGKLEQRLKIDITLVHPFLLLPDSSADDIIAAAFYIDPKTNYVGISPVSDKFKEISLNPNPEVENMTLGYMLFTEGGLKFDIRHNGNLHSYDVFQNYLELSDLVNMGNKKVGDIPKLPRPSISH